MASSHSSHSETAKMEQIVTEFFAKSLQIILESRSPSMSSRNFSGEQAMSSPSSSCSSSSSVRPRDKWFNLALRECSAALENIDLWRQSTLEPILVDVILVQRPLGCDPLNFSPKGDLVRNLSLKQRSPLYWNSDQDEFGSEAKSEKVIERWKVQYESGKSKDSNTGSRRSGNSTLHTFYKKLILLLRSLYATVRLLPAYKFFRDLQSSQIRPFTLAHRVSTFAEPFTQREEAEMQKFEFTPVDTSSGRICVSVCYRSAVSEISSEPSTPMSPQLIPDYVGSPLADPLKRFPILPVPGVSLQGSPSSLPFSRRHSWSYDRFKPSPPSISFSPSPTYSESHASVPNRRMPPSSLPPHPPEMVHPYKKNTNYDEYCPSSPLSTSPSPSLTPPMFIPGRPNRSTSSFRSESAPISAPPKLPSSALSNKQNLPPSPPLRGRGPGTIRTGRDIGPFHTGSVAEKSFSPGGDDTRKFPGWKIPFNSSPQISISRSSSRSFLDDFDDTEFPCPFEVDDDDMTDPGSRPESLDQKAHLFEALERGGLFPGRISQDAAVGALVRMLKKAAPLRQDLSSSVDYLQASRANTWNKTIQEPSKISEAPAPTVSSSINTSAQIMTKTTADALEELQGYREMKNLLLKQRSYS